jgi:hypothetical protein
MGVAVSSKKYEVMILCWRIYFVSLLLLYLLLIVYVGVS